MISCGSSHSVSLAKDGLYSWGANKFGQLGCDESTHRIPGFSAEDTLTVASGPRSTYVISKSGLLFGWGELNLDDDRDSPRFDARFLFFLFSFLLLLVFLGQIFK